MTPASLRHKIPSSLLFFLTPCLFSLLLFVVTNISCQSVKEPSSGEITLFFTADVGGRLDPCG